MIKFFRKIRQKLLSENKFSKYLIYAIGEIILVVIGILIALQINNWNEARNNDDKFKETFIEIDQNLKRTIESADELLEWYMRKDSLIYLVMHDKVSGDDYLNIGGLYNLITTEKSLNIPRSGYDNLIEDIENLPKKYKLLVDDIKTIYQSADNIKTIESYMSADITEYLKYLSYNQLWKHKSFFSDYQFGSEELKYFSSDFYKNAVSSYSSGAIGNHEDKISRIREKAHNVRLQIAGLLKEVSDALPDHSDFAHMQGIYLSKEDTINITLKNKTLFVRFDSYPESVLIPFDKSRFTAFRNWFCYMKYNEQGEIIGITERRKDNIIEYKKSK